MSATEAKSEKETLDGVVGEIAKAIGEIRPTELSAEAKTRIVAEHLNGIDRGIAVEVLLILGQEFCYYSSEAESDPAPFFKLAEEYGVLDLPMAQDIWRFRKQLAFFAYKHDFDSVAAIIEKFVERSDFLWIQHVPMAFALRKFLLETDCGRYTVPPAQIDQLLENVKSIIRHRRQGWRYLGNCVELQRVCAEIALSGVLAGQLLDGWVDFCIEEFGLSKPFWRVFEQARLKLEDLAVPEKLDLAHTLFGELESCFFDSNNQGALLVLKRFEALGVSSAHSVAKKLSKDHLDQAGLRLVSCPSTLQSCVDAEVAVVATMRNEMVLVDQFLSHYRALGVSAFLIVDNGSEDGTFQYLASQPDVCLFSADGSYADSKYGISWQQALLSLRIGRWSLVADADEFLLAPEVLASANPSWKQPVANLGRTQTAEEPSSWPEPKQPANSEQLGDTAKPGDASSKDAMADLISKIASSQHDADAVRIFMLDLYPKGELEEARFEGNDPFSVAPFCDREPFELESIYRGATSTTTARLSAMRQRLFPLPNGRGYAAQKIALLRYTPLMMPGVGFHVVANVCLFSNDLLFAHFKYHSGYLSKAAEEAERGEHYNNAEEYKRYAQESTCCFFDAEVSLPWYECDFVQRLLEAWS